MPDIHLYINEPSEEDVPAFEGLEDVVKRLEHVSEAKANPTTRVVAVTFTGWTGRTTRDRARHQGRRLRGLQALRQDRLPEGIGSGAGARWARALRVGLLLTFLRLANAASA